MREDNQGSRRGSAGFSLLEVLISLIVLALAGLVGAAYSVRGSADADWSRDRAFANQKALAILAELRGLVVSGDEDDAAALDAYDDDGDYYAPLTITQYTTPPYGLVEPDHPVSGNVKHNGIWRWSRSISVEEFEHQETRNRRRVTVRIYRRMPGEDVPGTQLAEVSGVVQTADDPLPGGQVYDLYVLAIENVPSPWVAAEGAEAFLKSIVSDLRGRNPGLDFRLHWIRRLGYGRDEEYAPTVNVLNTSKDRTPWAYVYPGTLPEGEGRATHYAADLLEGRYMEDGGYENFQNDYWLGERFTDTNDNGELDSDEYFGDEDADGKYDYGNEAPYAFADQYNHAKRAHPARVQHEARVEARLAKELTWRLMLDQMVHEPARFKNAFILNLHGQILPMPPVRNYSDAARSPTLRQGWRVVTHPERLRPQRVQNDDANSQAPRFRVYAYKEDFTSTETVMTQGEPFVDADKDGLWDIGETFTDWNGNGSRDASLPISVLIRGGDFTSAPNADTSPSIKILALPGGVDADGNGTADPYKAFAAATRLPEAFTDTNGDGVRQVAEPWLDLDGNGTLDGDDSWTDIDGDGVWSGVTEAVEDQNGNGRWDRDMPTETFTDSNGNGQWDAAEPYWDRDGDGKWTPPTDPKGYREWDPKDLNVPGQLDKYLKEVGEPFVDLDGSGDWTDGEVFQDSNGNGLWDSGYDRGEMHYALKYIPELEATAVFLYGTPLETPQVGTGEGLPTSARLYDLDYVPCPTPTAANAIDRFGRDLSVTGDVPKNTARWVIELPTASIRTNMASGTSPTPDGDAFDRMITVETRLGNDLTTGTMWPVRHEPTNASITYTWFADSVEDVPYSERFQFQGDPRHSPYADTDATGTSFANGYNWFFDDFKSSGTNAQGQWLAFDKDRLAQRWAGRSDVDVPRYMDWLRRGLTRSGAFFTNIGGLAFSTISLGGDIGGAAPDLDTPVPMDGLIFGEDGDVSENTLYDRGTNDIAGGRKIIRDGVSSSASRRSGGGWWSKPWLGEIWPDTHYEAYWVLTGNLRAGTGNHQGHFRRVLRSQLPSGQMPTGTTLGNARNELGVLGGTCFFNTGSAGNTFQQSTDDTVTLLYGNGRDLGQRYGLSLPMGVSASHPFFLDWAGDTKVNGLSVGPAFGDTTTYPRYATGMQSTYYTQQGREDGVTGSGFVRLTNPDGEAARIGVSSLYQGTEDGVAFLGRYALLSLVHAHARSGHPDEDSRVRQLPAIEVSAPAGRENYIDPAFIAVEWGNTWARWDSGLYEMDYPEDFAEEEGDLVYRLLYSNNDGATWYYLHNNQETTPGFMPRLEDGTPDYDFVVADAQDGDESYTWVTPADTIVDASYLIRVEAYHVRDLQHYAYMEERFDVAR